MKPLDLTREYSDHSGSIWMRTDEQVVVNNQLIASWDIRPGDAVIVMGGYDGFTCQMVTDRYPDCFVYTFEPQPHFYNRLVERFADNPRVHPYPYGLGIKDGRFPMIQHGNDRASFLTGEYAQLGEQQATDEGELREFTAAMDELGIDELAWLHLNCEQYEYLLLPHLITTGWIRRIGQLVVQTHPFPHIEQHPDARTWDVICERLAPTHELIWNAYGGWFAFSRPDRMVRDVAAELGGRKA
jgi:FkbM family methyltransferase